MVVNVASLCGYTDTMYKALKRLQDILGYDNRFQVLAFPCNQFGEQEPYEGEQVYQFAVGNYGVEFPIFSKIEVIGEDAHPAFNYLISEQIFTSTIMSGVFSGSFVRNSILLERSFRVKVNS